MSSGDVSDEVAAFCASRSVLSFSLIPIRAAVQIKHICFPFPKALCASSCMALAIYR